MKRYLTYKDSGVERLGDVPEHWEMTRLKFVASGKVEYGLNISSGEYLDSGVRFLRTTDIDDSGNLCRAGVYLSKDVIEDSYILGKGDLLISRSGTVGRAYVHSDTDEDCSFAGYLVRFRFTDLHLSKFIFYLTKSQFFDDFLKEESVESTIVNVNGQKYANLRFTLPLPTELPIIVAYLDRKTQEIDTLIEKKQALVALLREQRTALINRTVTKGLNPDVPMKDSGIEWLGEVPEHWDVPHIRFVARMDSGHTPSRKIPEYWQNCTIPWVSLSDTKTLAASDYITDTHYIISELGMANSSAHLIEKGAVVFTRDATIGLAAITTRPMAVSQHIIAWICGEQVMNKYLLYVIYVMKDELERLTMGATLKTIGMPDVKELKMPLPSINEQQEIISYLDVTRGQIDDTINREQQLIELLQELRTSLISEVVTGKIDVRKTVSA